MGKVVVVVCGHLQTYTHETQHLATLAHQFVLAGNTFQDIHLNAAFLDGTKQADM